MKNLRNLPLAVCMACALFTGCAAGTPPAGSQPAAAPVIERSAPSESAPPESASSESGAASAGEKPEPVYGSQIADGVYEIRVSSSSSMFRIVDARLTVADGEMTCLLTLGGKGYEKLYMGTGGEALADTEDKYVYFTENADGKYTYEVPVAALNQEIDCAAWSIKKEKWYDRTLVFESASIPAGALHEAGGAARPPADGTYEIAVSLTGGSGRAAVESPAVLTVKDGAATAAVVWGSPYYEKMTVGGVDYAPVNSGGNAAFEIPVTLDEDMAVTARTAAMSAPHDIGYTLRFDSASMKPVTKG